MKGIIVTQEIKDKNPFAENKILNSIYTGALPNKFWVTERVVGGYRGRTDLHPLDGWYDVVEPAITDTERLGTLYFDDVNEVFTYTVITKTPEEIAAEDEQNMNSDISQQNIDRRRNAGKEAFDRIKAIIERKFRTGEITGTQALNADKYFHPFIKDLNFGSWHIVQAQLNAEAATVPAGYQSLFTTIKTKVDNYIQNDF